MYDQFSPVRLHGYLHSKLYVVIYLLKISSKGCNFGLSVLYK